MCHLNLLRTLMEAAVISMLNTAEDWGDMEAVCDETYATTVHV